MGSEDGSLEASRVRADRMKEKAVSRGDNKCSRVAVNVPPSSPSILKCERGKESKAVENKEWERESERESARERIRESMGSLSSKKLFIFKLASPTVRRHSQTSLSRSLSVSALTYLSQGVSF